MSKSRKSLPQLKHGSEGSSQCGGHSELKLELINSIINPLSLYDVCDSMQDKSIRGVVMLGPQGSKTTTLKALATESKVNFLNMKVSELFPNCVDESENAVRVVFRKAKLLAPCILFIDEIDMLGSESLSSNDSKMRERVMDQLLTELNGVLGGIMVVVGTIYGLDKIYTDLYHLLHRLNGLIYIGLPDDETRRWLFDIKLRNMPIAEDVNVANLVDLTEGYTGAEIEAICHGAAMKALEENINAAIVTKEHFKAALATVSPRTPISISLVSNVHKLLGYK